MFKKKPCKYFISFAFRNKEDNTLLSTGHRFIEVNPQSYTIEENVALIVEGMESGCGDETIVEIRCVSKV